VTSLAYVDDQSAAFEYSLNTTIVQIVRQIIHHIERYKEIIRPAGLELNLDKNVVISNKLQRFKDVVIRIDENNTISVSKNFKYYGIRFSILAIGKLSTKPQFRYLFQSTITTCNKCLIMRRTNRWIWSRTAVLISKAFTESKLTYGCETFYQDWPDK